MHTRSMLDSEKQVDRRRQEPLFFSSQLCAAAERRDPYVKVFQLNDVPLSGLGQKHLERWLVSTQHKVCLLPSFPPLLGAVTTLSFHLLFKPV